MILSNTNNPLVSTGLLFRLALVLATIGCSGSAAQAQLTVKSLIGTSVSLSNRSYPEVEDAIKRFRNGDVKGAQEYLEMAAEKYPKLPPKEVTLAKMHSAARNATGVRIMLELAVRNNPSDPEAYLMLADQSFSGGRTTEAGALFEKADRLLSEFTSNEKRKRNFSIRVLAGGAAVAERRQQWEQAQKLLSQWIEADPDSDVAHQRLGNTAFRLKRYDQALQEFQQARQLNPDVAHASVALGNLYTREGDIENARKHFMKAYQEEKTNESTAQAYVQWLLQQGETKEAQQISVALRKLQPDSAVAWLLDGIVAVMAKDVPHAEQSLTKVLSIDPAHALATNLLALLLIDSDDVGKKERALSYAKVNAERFSQNSKANITLAWVLYKLNRGKEAEAALKRGAELGNLSADSTYLIARIMVEQGQAAQAIAPLKRLHGAKAGFFMYRKEAQKLLDKLLEDAKKQPEETK